MMNRFFTLLLAASSLTAVGQMQSIFLDGENDYINVFIPVESNDFSFSVEVKMTELPSTGVYIFDTRLDDQRGYFMWIRPNGLTDFGWENGQDNFNIVQVSLADVDWFNSWQQITIIQTGSALSMFVEGELKAELDGYLEAIASRDRIILGRRNNGPGHDFYGLMDNIFVGSGMLSLADIQLAKCNGNGDGLGTGFWNLDNGATNSVGTNAEAYIQLENGAAFVDFDSIQTGCVDSDACNFDPDASCDDGSCIYPPSIDLGDDIETCEESVTLNAGPGFDSYLWSTGDTTQSVEVSEADQYSVQVESGVSGNLYSADFGTQATCGLAGNTWVDCGEVLESNGSFSVGGWLYNNGCDYTTIVSQRPGGSCTDPYYGPGPYNGFHLSYENAGQFEFRLHQNSNGSNPIEPSVRTPAIEEEWVHLVGVFESGQSVKLFLNGELVDSQPTSIEVLEFCDYPFLIGSLQHGGNWSWDGKLDDVFAYSRALSDVEVLSVYESSFPSDGLSGLWQFEEGEGGVAYDSSGNGNHGAVTGATWSTDVPDSAPTCWLSDSISVDFLSRGCIDDYACNYDTTAQCDDGSCDYSCCPGPGCCDQGLTWNWELSLCQDLNPADINLDGCVQLNDLLDLLSAYGDCGTEESPWQCGDPLEYQGYDYETVQIGEQCWFAENLRSSAYQDGTNIQTGLEDAQWSSSIGVGAYSVYGATCSYCEDYTPELIACGNPNVGELFGHLYNQYAVLDERQLCPVGWYVPSAQDFQSLGEVLGGMNVAASQMKDELFWMNADTDNTINNSSGFSILPVGLRHDLTGECRQAGMASHLWTSDPNTDMYVASMLATLQINGSDPRHGFVVRCIQGAE